MSAEALGLNLLSEVREEGLDLVRRVVVIMGYAHITASSSD